MSRLIPFKEKMKAKQEAEQAAQEERERLAEQARIQKEKELRIERLEQEHLAKMEHYDKLITKAKHDADQRFISSLTPKPTVRQPHSIDENQLFKTPEVWLAFSMHPDIIDLPMPEKVRLFKKAGQQRIDRLNTIQTNVLGGGSSATFVDRYSLTFDGLTNEVTTTFSGSGVAPLNKTYSWWMKSTHTARNYSVFGYGGNKKGAFTPNFSSGRPLIWNGNNWYAYWEDTPAQDDGEWHHWMLYNDVLAITGSKLYVDGVEQPVNLYKTSGTVSNLQNQTQPLTIGSYQNNSGNSARHFEGSLDEFAIFSGDKTGNASTYYNNGKPTDLTTEPDLQGYWRFEEGVGSTANDSSGEGNHGTVNGATWSTDVP